MMNETMSFEAYVVANFTIHVPILQPLPTEVAALRYELKRRGMNCFGGFRKVTAIKSLLGDRIEVSFSDDLFPTKEIRESLKTEDGECYIELFPNDAETWLQLPKLLQNELVGML